jgi:tripartite-type tricarboxylate transporter receptor subunit TctC
MFRQLLAAAALAASVPVFAQGDFPNRPITMLVGFAPGGAADAAARIIARKLSENLGQPVNVDNRGGAGGNIAHQQMAAAAPDGYTILLGSVGPLTIAPHVVANLPYDPLKDFAPLTMAVTLSQVLVVHTGVPAKTLPEYVALAKQKKGGLDFGSSGIASIPHLAGAMLNQQAGIDIVHVPYKGGGPGMTDLLGGRLSSFYASPASASPHIESGRLRALAVTGANRSPFMPNVPTIAESGYPGVVATNWYAFVTSAKVPAPLVERWNRELVKVLRSPDVKEQFAKHWIEPDWSTREELAAFIRKEHETWGRVVKAAGIKAE